MLKNTNMMQIKPFSQADTDTVIELWNLCGLTRSWNNPRLDIERKLTVKPEWFLVGEVNQAIVASVMFGYEGHRGWVNYLAVHPSHQRKGYARQLMAYGEQLLEASGCPKLSLQIRATNSQVVAFYESLGFATRREIFFYVMKTNVSTARFYTFIWSFALRLSPQ